VDGVEGVVGGYRHTASPLGTGSGAPFVDMGPNIPTTRNLAPDLRRFPGPVGSGNRCSNGLLDLRPIVLAFAQRCAVMFTRLIFGPVLEYLDLSEVQIFQQPQAPVLCQADTRGRDSSVAQRRVRDWRVVC